MLTQRSVLMLSSRPLTLFDDVTYKKVVFSYPAFFSKGDLPFLNDLLQSFNSSRIYAVLGTLPESRSSHRGIKPGLQGAEQLLLHLIIILK